MGMCIKNAMAEELARQVAELTGESLTEAIRKSLEERLTRLRGATRRQAARLEDGVREICAAYRGLPVVDPREADAILGYGDDGVP